MLFRERLTALRDEHGFKWPWLAQKAGIAIPRIRKCAAGEVTPYLEEGVKIARALGVDLNYLVGNTDDPTPPQKKKAR